VIIKDKNHLEHFGVLGMRWGQRKGSGSRSAGGVHVTVGGKTTKIADLRVKGKNQSQKKFELETARGILDNRRSSRAERKVAEQIMKKHLTKAERKVEKVASKMRNLQKEADFRRQFAKDEIDYDVNWRKNKAEKSRMPFDAKAHKAKLEIIYKDDLNATPESIHKENVTLGRSLAATALLLIGASAAQAYVLSKYA